MSIALVVYAALCTFGRAPRLENVKHNQLLGPFMAGYVVWLVGPIERALVGRVSPNLVTAVSLVCCAATGVVAAMGHLGMAVWLYAFGGILDILDGRLARLSGQQTKAGALFDSVSDRWAELFVFAGYAWYLRETPWLAAVLAAMGGSFMVSYTRARAESLGIELHGGMMQRAERILMITLGSLVAAWFSGAAVEIIGVVMTLCAVSCTSTAITRLASAYRTLAAQGGTRPVVKLRPVTIPEIVVVPVQAKSPLRESAELAIR
ncbi:MAG: CDP-alcohol phosphatidyltransferase family protein [Myxococcota bacterium]|nr:CDP-alcohol phosphatidyltransferase family protein [Myxococcota bacterium]